MGATLLERERERELAELSDALAAARERRGRMVLVEAPAGLGKTTLLRAAADAAAELGFTTLRARASELEHDFAYGCVRQLLEPVVARGGEDLFAGAAALSKPLFLPSGDPGADSAFSMLHGLYWLLNNLAEVDPVLLLVDDLHWSDPESLRFLNYLAPRLDGLALAVVATARPAEGDVAELARLAAAPEAVTVRPRPLTAEATAALGAQLLESELAPEFAAACRDATGGNPFFLAALLREVRDRGLAADARTADRVRGIGPAAVAQAVLLRLAGQPPAAAQLVRAVAVLGDGAALAEAAELAAVDEEEAVRAADLLVRLGVLERADGLEFAHPIVREAVLSDVGAHERAEAHARAAALLARAGASEERIAAQLGGAEPAGDPKRVELLRRVAADALVRGAPAAAAATLRRALAEPPPDAVRAEVLLELGSAELRVGAPGAMEHLAAAAELIDDPAAFVPAVRQLANALTVAGEPDRAVEALAGALERVPAEDRESALLLAAELATHSLQASPETRPAAAARLERHGRLDGATPAERLVRASRAFERARASETAAEAAAHLAEALADGRLLGDEQLDIFGPFYDVVLGLLATDALDLADAAVDQGLADARGRASIPAIAYLTDRRGWISLRRGAVAQAEADGRTGLELLTAHGIPLGVPLARGLLVAALTEAGELDEAEAALGEEAGVPPIPTGNFLLEARALLRLAQGRAAEGLDDLVELGRRDERWGAANPLGSRWRPHAALALAGLGRAEEARATAAEGLERARRWGATCGLGLALRAAALVEGDEDGLREAVAVLEGSPARLEHAKALVDLGASLRRDGRRADARGVLADGLERAEHCGAGALAERAAVELRAAGGRSSDPEGSGVAQLTVSERRVAELAADGRSNPEIAQELFVTRKTVETHLGHVYRKLDIGGRGELTGALAAG